MNIQDKGSLEGILQKTRHKKLILSILYINSKGGQIGPLPKWIKTKNNSKGIGLKRNVHETSQANEKSKEPADNSRKATSGRKRKNDDIICNTSSNKRKKQLKLTFNMNNFL